MKTWLSVLCIALLAGCSSVEMKEPFPVSPLSDEVRAQLEGTWQIDESVFHIAFASNGVAQLACMEWDEEKEAFEMKTFPLYFAKQGKVLYVSMRGEDEPCAAPGGYTFMEVKPNDGQLVAWMANTDYFKEQVAAGKLKGTVEKDKHSTTVKLDAPSLEILGLISTNNAAFNYKEPIVLRRVQ
ncbi:hypothetical protein [Pontiella sulfatireligans]|uniref:Lipocalin-like domain-containing protein n=1 Tax=Pontiella sulfatireligans TaxID=2750658 RepID=A0A6C2UUG2_9BACT|nr:hypothetical protein [Pontiella sulfatireligans]VGO22526.1 hypothetical protein SCARR_04610 [Pontiella sulfatireligans]